MNSEETSKSGFAKTGDSSLVAKIIFSAGILVVILSNAEAFATCNAINRSIESRHLGSTVVSIGYEEDKGNAKANRDVHAGNAVFFKKHQSQFVFLTAHHVLHTVCSAIFDGTAKASKLYYQVRTHNIQTEIDLKGELCDRILSEEYEVNEAKLDFAFFSVPEHSIHYSEEFVKAPPFDSYDRGTGEVRVIGYPELYSLRPRNTMAANLSQTQLLGVSSEATPGWSGSPVFAKVPGTDGEFALQGLLVEAVDAKGILSEWEKDLEKKSDLRIGLIALETANQVVANAQSIVLPIGLYRYSDWQYMDNEIEESLKRFFKSENDKYEPARVRNFIVKKSPLAQFEAASVILEMLSQEDFGTDGIFMPMLEVYGSLQTWCYYNRPLANALIRKIKERRPKSLSKEEAVAITEVIEAARKPLEKAYRHPSKFSDVFAYANGALSLLYRDPNQPSKPSPEFAEYGIASNKYLAYAVYDHARIRKEGFGDKAQFVHLAEKALEIDESLIPANWSLADHWNREGTNLDLAVESYTRVIEHAEAAIERSDDESETWEAVRARVYQDREAAAAAAEAGVGRVEAAEAEMEDGEWSGPDS